MNPSYEKTRRPVRVLIVDDSPTMRRLIRNGLTSDERISVVAEAGSAAEARDIVKRIPIDVITLDVEMPGMDGLEFLARLMRARPMPVVMLSSLTQRGSDMALRALSMGAVDCIEKPKFGEAQATFTRLAEIISEVCYQAFECARTPKAFRVSNRSNALASSNGKVVLIGASTGGVEALERVFAGFPKNCPPTLVTQHMPSPFLSSFARRLNITVPPEVRLAQDGEEPQEGVVLIAPGGEYHLGFADSVEMRTKLQSSPKLNGHRPSVDVLFRSAIPFSRRIVAVLLTGMGRDGAVAMKDLRDAGANCIAQDKETSIVFGMPRAAYELGAVDRMVALDDIADRILNLSMHEADQALEMVEKS